MSPNSLEPQNWHNTAGVSKARFVCGFCSHKVANNRGYFYTSSTSDIRIIICPHCGRPTFLEYDKATPGPLPGNDVSHVPEAISRLYLEARAAASANAFTSSVLVCRKILMHIAVQKGAKAGEAFTTYVKYLADHGFIPPDGHAWVNYIRSRSNEANHEIILMDRQDAIGLISFIEMLLRFIYEFPNKIPTPPTPSKVKP